MLLFCCGMIRSGSTVQYQIASEIVESKSKGMTIGWIGEPREEFLNSLSNIAHRKDKFLVVKCHQYTPEAHLLIEDDRAKAVYIYRDLRDVAVSLSNKFFKSVEDALNSNWLSSAIENYYHWTSLDNIYISRYEDMVKELKWEVLKISFYLDISLEPNLVNQIIQQLELNKQIDKIKKISSSKDSIILGEGDRYDPVSQLHNNHIHSGKWGQWKESLSKEQIEFIETWAFSWFVDRGYPLSTFEKDNTKTAIEHFKQGRIFKQNGKLSEAENSYRQAVMQSPNSYLYHYNLGEILLILGKTDCAINAYRHAIHLNPKSALSHQRLGMALSQAGQLNQAVEHYRQATKLKPNTPRYENSLNLALSQHK